MVKQTPIYSRIKDAFNGIADSKIATELGVEKQSVYQWKIGRTKPSIENLLKAEEKTGLPYKWFLTGDKAYLSTENKEEPNNLDKPMTLERFIEELKAMGAEDFHSIKSMRGLSPADMEEILATARRNAQATAQAMIELRIKGKRR